MSPNKALESTIAALASPGPAATRSHAPVIGKPATDSYVDALHRYVAELGLDDAVQFAGHASDDTVAAAYASADVLVVTSEHEGFCVPVVEAMSAGLPVVAFDQGALPEVLGGAGVLVRQDPFALAAAIAALLADAPRARRVGAGRRRLAELDLVPRPTGSSTCWSRWPGGCPPMSAIHQFVPMLHRGDAVGRHTLRLRDVMVAGGSARALRRAVRSGDGGRDAAFGGYEDGANR